MAKDKQLRSFNKAKLTLILHFSFISLMSLIN